MTYSDAPLLLFNYNRNGKTFKVSYHQTSEDVPEAAEEMKHWADKAYGAALRAGTKKNKKS